MVDRGVLGRILAPRAVLATKWDLWELHYMLSNELVAACRLYFVGLNFALKEFWKHSVKKTGIWITVKPKLPQHVVAKKIHWGFIRRWCVRWQHLLWKFAQNQVSSSVMSENYCLAVFNSFESSLGETLVSILLTSDTISTEFVKPAHPFLIIFAAYSRYF